MAVTLHVASAGGPGEGVSLAVLLFAGTFLILLTLLIVTIMLVVSRRRASMRDSGRKPRRRAVPDAWEESARRMEAFEKEDEE